MFLRLVLTGVLAVVFVGLTTAGQEKKPDEKKKDEPRKGTVTGVVAAKGDNWIEVKADGEDKARKYFAPKDDPVMKVVNEAAIESRVSLDWQFGERFRVMKLEILKKGSKEPTKDEKKDPGKEDKKDEPRKGSVTGVVSGKGDNWIEVTADGEEKARKYVPHWRGGAPAAGGGPDKDMLAKIKDTPLKSRVKLDWEFEERARVVKIEVLKKPEEKK